MVVFDYDLILEMQVTQIPNKILLDNWIKNNLMFIHPDGAQAWTGAAIKAIPAFKRTLLNQMLYMSYNEFDQLLANAGYRRKEFLGEIWMNDDGICLMDE